MSDYHVPVMLMESIEGLDIDPEGVYVDLTFGGGGHSREILKRLRSGHLYAFDQDEEAEENAQNIEKRSFTFIKANFRYLKKYLRVHGVTEVHGILGDLGISSHQIDHAERGFSTRKEGKLDMRMSKGLDTSAAEMINEISESDLVLVLRNFGEVHNARVVARAICSARTNKPIETTAELVDLISPFAKRGKRNQYLAQVFQAIRIAVNDEMGALEDVLYQGAELLRSGGKFVVMTYHSLEDRMVKNFFNKGRITGEVEKDIYGNLIRPFDPVNRKPITASLEEVERNQRARSAKLRIAQKVIKE